MLFLSALAAQAVLWALWDAWRPRHGALHYAQGEWVLALGDVESLGTISVSIDLPRYLLVRFTPQMSDGDQRQTGTQHHNIKAQWLHLEYKKTVHFAGGASALTALDHERWLALRRALAAALPAQLQAPVAAPRKPPISCV